MFLNVSYWTAFSAGVLSFFSPCLLPLIPAYIMYLAGSFEKEYLEKKRVLIMIQTLGFVAGFTIIFMLLGVSASALGKLFATHKLLLSRISGLLILLFGIYSMDLVKIPFLSRDYRKVKTKENVSFLTALGMGMAFAFGWTPCFGPILGAILASTAAMSQQVSDGVKLLFTYSMGMAIPFLITAFFISTIESYTQKFSAHSEKLKKITGIIMILLGLLILTGQLGPLVNVFL